MFLGLTVDDSPERRRLMALRSAIWTLVILAAFMGAGTLILGFFGISIPGLRIAGGIMITRIAFEMNTGEHRKQSAKSKEHSLQKEDISFTPMAMPSLAGPGSIAVTIGFSLGAENAMDYLAITTGIAAICIVTWLVLRAATRVVRYLGASGLEAIRKVMAFLFLCVGVQFIVNGVTAILSDPGFVNAVHEALQ